MVERMRLLQQNRSQAKIPTERVRPDRLIAAADQEIDQLIYSMYGLIPTEVELVERWQV
jgi:hypothetical protein